MGSDASNHRRQAVGGGEKQPAGANDKYGRLPEQADINTDGGAYGQREYGYNSRLFKGEVAVNNGTLAAAERGEFFGRHKQIHPRPEVHQVIGGVLPYFYEVDTKDTHQEPYQLKAPVCP
jgi:hypothetical protein